MVDDHAKPQCEMVLPMLDNVASKASRAVQRLGSAREQGGIRGVAGESLRLIRRLFVIPVTAVVELVFDARMGVRTRGEVRHESELIPVSVGGDPRFYQPIYLFQWRKTLAAIPVEPATATFVDLGAGLGRAVILAAERGFRRVVGVELDAELAAKAEENVRRWRARRGAGRRPGQEVVIAEGDAATYPLPDGPLVVLLYNPFGPTTLRLVLRHLADRKAAAGEPAYVAYLNPINESVFAEFPELVRHAGGRGWSVYRLEPVNAEG